MVKGPALARVKAVLAEKGDANAEPEPPRRPGLWDAYGAPCLLLFAVHERLAMEYACFDLGLLVENFCLAAEDGGLGTCIMAMIVRYADALHDLVPQAPDGASSSGSRSGTPTQRRT